MINLKQLPRQPGIYRFLNQQGKLLYIGKAKNLRNRVRSYFVKSAELSPAKQLLVARIKKIEYIVVFNETEALLLESTLIKKHQPPFNIDLKDDKSWQYIKITNEPYPKIITVRKIAQDKAKYFGPYTSGQAVRQTLRLLKKIFPYRTCNRDLTTLPKGRVCLQYHLGRCLGPCEKKCDKKEYDAIIKQVHDFLSGKTELIMADLKNKMELAAKKREYEKAALYRNQITAIKKMTVRQRVVSTRQENQDFLNLYQEDGRAVVTLFKVRQGKLLDQQNFNLKKVRLLKEGGLLSDAEILEQFSGRYYAQTTDLPKQLILPQRIETDLKIIVPQQGDKKKLLHLAKINAQEFFKQQQASWEKAAGASVKKLIDLKTLLQLQNVPNRIEGYDVSNISGQEAVGSLAVMTDGKIDKSQYRRFKIKTISSANDPAMIGEVVKRRMNNNWPRPDLILIDGGLTQINAALNSLGDKKIPLIGLAKKQEEIYLPGQKIPLKLPKFSPALQLLQQLRDEAHRFAVNYHRKLRKKKLIKTAR